MMIAVAAVVFVILLLALVFALARSAAVGDRMSEDWLQRQRDRRHRNGEVD